MVGGRNAYSLNTAHLPFETLLLLLLCNVCSLLRWVALRFMRGCWQGGACTQLCLGPHCPASVVTLVLMKQVTCCVTKIIQFRKARIEFICMLVLRSPCSIYELIIQKLLRNFTINCVHGCTTFRSVGPSSGCMSSYNHTFIWGREALKVQDLWLHVHQWQGTITGQHNYIHRCPI